jgi:hypothetical protein
MNSGLRRLTQTLLVTASLIAVVGCAGQRSNSGAPSSPATPGNNNQGTAGSNQVKLAWASNLGEQQGFDIEQSTDGVTFTQIQQVPDGTNTVTVTVPTVGKNYYFRIRGYNQSGYSPYTSVVTIMVAG